MFRQVLLISVLLFLGEMVISCDCIVKRPESEIVSYSISQLSDTDTDTNTDSLSRRMLMHRIDNKELKRQLFRYDSTYRDSDAATEGLAISCQIHDDSIVYWIAYAININHISNLILCEPIAGKSVYLDIWNLYKDFSLPSKQSVEILKYANNKEYEQYKQIVAADSHFDNGLQTGSYEGRYVLSEFVSWHLIFDNNQQLLRIDTIGSSKTE